MSTPETAEWVVGRVLARQAEARPDQNFLQFGDDAPVTIGAVDLAATRIGNALRTAGVEFGDRVIVMLRNSVEFVEGWFGINRIGAVLVPVNTAYKGMFLEHVVNDSGARVAIIDRDFLPLFRESEARMPHLAVAFIVNPDSETERAGFARVRAAAFAELLAGSAVPVDTNVATRDIGAIIYTSGTTGRSKGVLLPHGHLYLNPHNYIEQLGLGEFDRFYCCLPLFHANALLLQTYGALILGCPVIYARAFSASGWLDDIKRHRATVTNLLGAMTEFIYRQPPRPGDSAHELRIATAVPLPASFGPEFERRFGVKLIELYGTTEVNCPFYMPRHEPQRAGSCGRLLERWFDCRLVDSVTEQEVSVGETGELLIRPKEPWTVMVGYHGMPEETVKTWRNFWFHTGDAMRRDAEGYYYFVDRMKDCIRRRAENISSFEVEQVLIAYEGVAEAAAIGVPSPFDDGEHEVMACIVPNRGVALDPAALERFCEERMPGFAVPRIIEFFDELPKTPTQKVRKHELRERGAGAAAWRSPKLTARRSRAGRQGA